MAEQPIEIEVWSDIACPWCWVGSKNLEKAKELFGHDVNVTWRAYQLDPDAFVEPEPTINYVEKLVGKYQVSKSDAQAMIDRITKVGSDRGIDFRFDRLSLSNTFNAHRLLAWAKSLGQQSVLKERLFSVYLHEGLSLNDPEVLVRAATEIGLDGKSARAVLDSDQYADSVHKDRAEAQTVGVRGVPFFVVDEQIALSGAQPPEVIVQALEEAMGSRDQAGDSVDDLSCSTDGC